MAETGRDTSESRKGIIAIVTACLIWGFVPIFYRELAHVPPMEVLAQRTIWSLVTFAIVLMIQRRFREVAALLGQWSGFVAVAIAGLVISVNWFTFILATQIDRMTESSLGYYIFPLVSVLFGILFFGERMTRGRAVAVALATMAVAVLTIGLGAMPWISLVLAVSFSFYGVMKKRMEAGPVVSVTAEVVLLSPLALIWIAGAHGAGWTAVGDQPPGAFGQDLRTTLLLIASGALTAGPLILFSYATRRISLAATGLIQYLNPTLQFMVAIAVFGEVPTVFHWIAFPLIWVALTVFTIDSLRAEHRARGERRAALAQKVPPAS